MYPTTEETKDCRARPTNSESKYPYFLRPLRVLFLTAVVGVGRNGVLTDWDTPVGCGTVVTTRDDCNLREPPPNATVVA
ncbi:hypothetical protein Tco_0544360 [Tanacetum coccineum]